MSSATNQWFATIFKAHKTLMQMLKDRGYLIGDKQLNMTLEELKAKFGDNVTAGAESSNACECLNSLYKKAKEGEDAANEDPEEETMDKIAVFWCCDQDKVNSDMVKRVQI